MAGGRGQARGFAGVVACSWTPFSFAETSAFCLPTLDKEAFLASLSRDTPSRFPRWSQCAAASVAGPLRPGGGHPWAFAGDRCL